MNIDVFRQRFSRHWQGQTQHDFPLQTQSRPAAVLVALQEVDGELNVILTKRAEHLIHHPGQISFPGGKYEDSDKDIITTALREAHEEVGLPTEQVEILGRLPNYKTISGFEVTPIIGYLNTTLDVDKDLSIDTNEVERVFQVPLSYVFTPQNILIHEVNRANVTVPVYFIPYQDFYIWGATAGMLVSLQKHIIST